MALHSIFGTSIQVGEGDYLEVRIGPENAPERIFNTTVDIVHMADGDWEKARHVYIPPFLGEEVVVLVCTVETEVPEAVVQTCPQTAAYASSQARQSRGMRILLPGRRKGGSLCG